MPEISDEVLYGVGRVLHEARMRECYGNMRPSARRDWPASIKEFRAQRHIGQPWDRRGRRAGPRAGTRPDSLPSYTCNLRAVVLYLRA